MKVLLLGSGGREHALAWKLAQSPMVRQIAALPGSDAIRSVPRVRCVLGKPADPEAVVRVANEIQPDLVVIGPEDPLAAGVTDALQDQGLLVFGPTQAAARLESSKSFAKYFMREHNIPTADFVVCKSHDDALAVLADWDVERDGVVIKADALAAGKGVVVTHDREVARSTIHGFMIDPACTVKTEQILLEARVKGREVSAFAICDGQEFITLGYACDYKRVADGDKGPNTGGMGSYVPIDWPDQRMRHRIESEIFRPVVDGMRKRGTPFVGFLFAGLMIEHDRLNVIEFNVRLGDPETQVLLPLLEDDLAEFLWQAARGRLNERDSRTLCMRSGTALHVVLASKGYPSIDGSPMMLDQTISLPEHDLNPESGAGRVLFIAGARRRDDTWINSGGRVLGLTAVADSVEQARSEAYAAIQDIAFNGAHWRTDIGR